MGEHQIPSSKLQRMLGFGAWSLGFDLHQPCALELPPPPVNRVWLTLDQGARAFHNMNNSRATTIDTFTTVVLALHLECAHQGPCLAAITRPFYDSEPTGVAG